jgi:signal transduction histidine kinase
VWPIALILAGAAVAAQAASWWMRSPAVMVAGTVATVGLLLCLPHLWRRHREDIQHACRSAEHVEQARRAADAQVSAERARVTEQWQAWTHSQFEAFHDSVEGWCRDLRTVLREREKPEASLPHLSPQTAKLLSNALDDVDEELVDVQDACEHAIVFLAQRLQTGGLQIQEKASGLTDRPEPGLPELGIEIDHLATTFAHHAQSLRILGGSWTGQQWQQTVPLTDIVRAAGGQITDYRRVVIGGEPDLGVKDFAAEWLIHLVAELLGNATNYSPSTKEVTAQLEAVPSGAVIQIDDRGTGMTEARLQRALELVSGPRDVSIRDLQTPQVGLAVVGNIARRLNIRVSLGRSPYGGIRAVVLVPMDLLEAIDPVYTMPLPQGTSSAASAEERQESSSSARASASAHSSASSSSSAHSPLPTRARREEYAPASASFTPSRSSTSTPTPTHTSVSAPTSVPDSAPEADSSFPTTGLPRRRSPRSAPTSAPAETPVSSIGTDEDPEAAASFMSSFVLGGRTSSDETDSPREDDDR